MANRNKKRPSPTDALESLSGKRTKEQEETKLQPRDNFTHPAVHCGVYVWQLICDRLDRMDVWRASRVCIHFSNTIYAVWTLMPTRLQREIIEKLCTLTPERWMRSRWGDYSDFPREYLVTSGPSTGKTLIALCTAAELLRRGVKIFLTVPLQLCAQWQAEHLKFAEANDLPPLCVVHPEWTHNWKSQLAAGALPLIPRDSLHAKIGIEFLKQGWETAICDDVSQVPKSLCKYTESRRAEGVTFFCINFHASAEQTNVASHLSDPELGELPALVAEVRKYKCEFPRDALEVLELQRSSKTLVLSNVRREKAVAKKTRNSKEEPQYENALIDLPVQQWENCSNVIPLSGAQRVKLIDRFAATTSSAMLIAPLKYMSRGFNLFCETLVIFTNHALKGELLLQVLGRVRRTGTPFRKVFLKIYQYTPIRPHDLAFFTLIPVVEKTSTLVYRAEAFNSICHVLKRRSTKPWILHPGTGKILSIEPLRSLSTLQLFAHLFPEEVERVKHYSSKFFLSIPHVCSFSLADRLLVE